MESGSAADGMEITLFISIGAKQRRHCRYQVANLGIVVQIVAKTNKLSLKQTPSSVPIFGVPMSTGKARKNQAQFSPTGNRGAKRRRERDC